MASPTPCQIAGSNGLGAGFVIGHQDCTTNSTANTDNVANINVRNNILDWHTAAGTCALGIQDYGVAGITYGLSSRH